MTESFDPYRRWLSIPPKDQPADHYRLLGVEQFESDPEVIRDAADRQMVHVRSYQLGKYSDLSQKLLNELAAARVCLLNPEKKAAYDAELRERLVANAPSASPSVPIPAAAARTANSAEEQGDTIAVWSGRLGIPLAVLFAVSGAVAFLLLGALIWWVAARGGSPERAMQPPPVAQRDPSPPPAPPPPPPSPVAPETDLSSAPGSSAPPPTVQEEDDGAIDQPRIAETAVDPMSDEAEDAGKPDQAARPDGAVLHNLLSFYETLAKANQDCPASRDLVESTYRKVVGMREELAAALPEATGYYRALGNAYADWAAFLHGAERHEEAERLYGNALSMQQALLDRFPAVAEYRVELAESHRGLADVLAMTGRAAEAQEHLAAAERLGEHHASADQAPTGQQTRFTDFSTAEGLSLVGDASLFEDRLRLAPARTWMVGGMWLAEKQRVAAGFDTTFRFQMSDGAADGFAFVVQNHSPGALGSEGSSLGYGDAHRRGGIPNSIAVEFDTYWVALGEFGPHISVQTNGTGPNQALPAFSLGWVVAEELCDGAVHTARIRYVPGTLAIYLDDLEDPVLTVPVELASLLDLDGGSAWVGFTAATGDHYQNHDILSWEYQTLAGPESQRLAEALPPRAVEATGETARPPDPPEDGNLLDEMMAFYQQFAAPGRAAPETRLQVAEACWSLGAVHQQFKQFDAAEEALEAAMRIWQSLTREFPDEPAYRSQLRTGSTAFAVFISSRGHAFRKAGRLDEAIELYEQALEGMKATRGEGHRNTLLIQHNLAVAYARAGRTDEAIGLNEQTLDVRKTISGEAAPDTLLTQHNLAVGYPNTGRVEEAIALFEQTLDAWKDTRGEDHSDTLRTQQSLAVAYRLAGRVEEAIALFEQTLDARKATLGDDHADTLEIQCALAAAYRQAGRHEAGIATRQRSVIGRKVTLGENHPDTLVCLFELGTDYCAAGRLEEAIAILEPTLAAMKTKLGEDHPDTLKCRRTLHQICANPSVSTATDAELAARRQAGLLGIFPPDPREAGWRHPRMRFCREIAENEELFAQVIKLRPDDGQLWVERGRMLALRSRWPEAVEAYRRGIGFQGIADETFETTGALLLTGDEDAYRDLCATTVKEAGEVNDPFAAYQLARFAALGPSAIAPERAIAWAEQAVAGQENAWHVHALALAHYRAGNFEETVRFCEESNTLPWSASLLNWVVLSMAHQRLGDSVAARAAFDQAKVLAQAIAPAVPGEPAKGYPPNWIEFQVLHREAAELLGEEPEAECEPAAPPAAKGGQLASPG